MKLESAAIALNAAVIVLCLAYAYSSRKTPDRVPAIVLACVWIGGLGLDLVHTAIVEAIPSPDVEPIASVKTRALLEVERAVYLAWPALILGWIRWIFNRSRPLLTVLFWLVASILPIAFRDLFGGKAWFGLAAAFHLAALAWEGAAFTRWLRLRERPRAWHSAALIAAVMSALPAIPFLSSENTRAAYSLWVLRGLILGHLALVATLGGALWSRET